MLSHKSTLLKFYKDGDKKNLNVPSPIRRSCSSRYKNVFKSQGSIRSGADIRFSSQMESQVSVAKPGLLHGERSPKEALDSQNRDVSRLTDIL